jgi:polysaccharide export outer membrane protein
MRLLSWMHRIATALTLTTLLALCGSSVQAQFIGAAPVSSAGLNVPHKVTTDPEILYPAKREMLLMSGDMLRVNIFGTVPAYEAGARISLDGTVRLPLAGTLRLEGLSLVDAEQAIATRMEELQMYRNPQVTIQLVEGPGHVVTLLGIVHGSFTILGHKRLFDVLAGGGGGGTAGGGGGGGIPSTASPIIMIDRPGVPDPIVVDLGSDPAHATAANIPIFAGDTITTGDVGGVYIIGAVRTPGVQKLNGLLPTTVLQALSVAGGAVWASKQNETRLIRTVGSERSVVMLPFKKILHGEAADPILQADDIIYVPPSAFKGFFANGVGTALLGLGLTAATIARY